eukprot:TRINITY_DN3957_c0_g1_i3.p1 TRINITY_DN3957_c0_g1~~TRINITY_DN3957_c0_g1_i3.p1  ORF type:complete len:286 (-),score=52.58 TRINITY_DN3957_c0_g1_i3:79-936(-)
MPLFVLPDSPLQEEDMLILEELAKSINGLLAETNFPHERTFIKLSTRSPKDSAMGSPFMRQLLIKQMEDLPTSIDQLNYENNIMQRFIRCIPTSMTYENGHEALNIMCRSERVDTDLKRWIKYPDSFPMNIVLREFDNELTPEMEFRGFVHNNTLTAVSQYYTLAYYPQLKENQDELINCITSYYEEIVDKIPIDNYIIDFVVNPSGVKVIELNPWATTTGAALFEWSKDRSILIGDSNFEFRLVEEPEANVLGSIYPEYQDLINGVVRELGKDRTVVSSWCALI